MKDLHFKFSILKNILAGINEEKIPGLGSIDPLLRRGLDVMMAQQSAGDPFWAGKERLLFFDAVDNHVTSVPLMKVCDGTKSMVNACHNPCRNALMARRQ
jgi:hypothetical protein